MHCVWLSHYHAERNGLPLNWLNRVQGITPIYISWHTLINWFSSDPIHHWLKMSEHLGLLFCKNLQILSLMLLARSSSDIPVPLWAKNLKSCCKTLRLSASLLYDHDFHKKKKILLCSFQLYATFWQALVPDDMARNHLE